MAIIATGGSNFQPCPVGVHQACCVDVIDHGLVEVTWQGKTKQQHKVSIVWQVEELMEAGEPFQVRSRYTLTLSEKGRLRPDLESWRGRAFTPDELRGFDLENLIGVNCLLNVTHAHNNEKTYANVSAVMPLRKGMAKLGPVNYTRVKDRPESQQQAGHTNGHTVSHDDPFGGMDDVPFAWALPLLLPALELLRAAWMGGWA